MRFAKRFCRICDGTVLDDSPSPPHLLPMSERTWKKKYRWVLTWPGEEKEDWCAFHDGLLIGRVARDKTSAIPIRGTFAWNGNCSEWWGFKRVMPQNGRCAEAWEAAKAVEDWYDAGLERSGPRPAWVEEIINRHPDLNPPGWRGK